MYSNIQVLPAVVSSPPSVVCDAGVVVPVILGGWVVKLDATVVSSTWAAGVVPGTFGVFGALGVFLSGSWSEGPVVVCVIVVVLSLTVEVVVSTVAGVVVPLPCGDPVVGTSPWVVVVPSSVEGVVTSSDFPEGAVVASAPNVVVVSSPVGSVVCTVACVVPSIFDIVVPDAAVVSPSEPSGVVTPCPLGLTVVACGCGSVVPSPEGVCVVTTVDVGVVTEIPTVVPSVLVAVVVTWLPGVVVPSPSGLPVVLAISTCVTSDIPAVVVWLDPPGVDVAVSVSGVVVSSAAVVSSPVFCCVVVAM